MDLAFLIAFVGGVVTTIAVLVLFSLLKPHNPPERIGASATRRRSRLRILATGDLYVSLSGLGFSANRVPIENASFDGIALRWDRRCPPPGSAVKMIFDRTMFETTVIGHDDEILRLRYKSSVTPSSAEMIRSACLHGRNKPLTKHFALGRG